MFVSYAWTFRPPNPAVSFINESTKVKMVGLVVENYVFREMFIGPFSIHSQNRLLFWRSTGLRGLN